MERTCAFALEIQDIWQFYTEAYNVGFLFLFALAWHSVSFLFGFRSPFFSPLSLCWYGSYLNSWAHNIKLLPKWTFVSDFEFGFTSAFPVMSLSKSTKLLLAHTRRRRSREKESEWLRFSINSINVQFFFGLLCVMLYFIPFARTMLLRIPNASCVFDTQLNKKANRNYNGSSDYRLCWANVKRRRIKSKQFALFWMRPYLLSIIGFFSHLFLPFFSGCSLPLVFVSIFVMI